MRTILLLILTAQVCFGQAIPSARRIASPLIVAGSGVCATTDTAIPHDEFLEGFQTATTGFENSNWSFPAGTTNQITMGDTTALTSGKPAGACNQAFKIVVPTDGTETYAQWDRGSQINPATTAFTVTFYLYIESLPDVSGEAYYTVAGGALANTPGTVCFRMNLSNVSGTASLFVFGSNSSASEVVSTGAWHKIAIYIDTSTTGTLSTFTVDGGTPRAFNRNSAAFQYLFFGATQSLDVNDNGTLWYDLVCVNTP